MTTQDTAFSLRRLGDTTVDQVGWVIFGASAATLAGAYFFQYVLDLPPCEMCLWQRPPYWTAILMGVLAATAHHVRPLPRNFDRLLLGVAAAVFMVGAGIAFFHVGVEQKWWEGPTGCAGVAALPESFQDFQTGLAEAKVVRCDEIPWSFLGVSLAGYNMLISLALAAVAAWGVFKAKEPR